MKILLCCVVKLENMYIEEWIKHYKKLGVSKIVIYDNDNIESEYIENVKYIKDLIDESYIDVYHIPNLTKPQLYVYNECYKKYGKEYDWLMFFDIDEYLILESSSTVQEQLSKELYKNFDMIHVNWKLYDDNDILYVNNNYSIVNRFTRPLKESIPRKYRLDQEIKTILRGNLNNIEFTLNPHTITNQYLSCCDPLGNPISSIYQKNINIVHSEMWLNHYITKTLEEYVTIKLKRGGGTTKEQTGLRYNFGFFFIYNRRTNEKLELLKQLLSKEFSSEESEKILKGICRNAIQAPRKPEILYTEKFNPFLNEWEEYPLNKKENNIHKKGNTVIKIINKPTTVKTLDTYKLPTKSITRKNY